MVSRRLKIATWVGSAATLASTAFIGYLAYQKYGHRTDGYARHERCRPIYKGYHYSFFDRDGIKSIELYDGFEEVFSLRVPKGESKESLSNQVWAFEDGIPTNVAGCLGLDRRVTHFVVTDLKYDEVEFVVLEQEDDK